MNTNSLNTSFAALLAGTLLLPVTLPGDAFAAQPMPFATSFGQMEIDGLKIAYREAGNPANPTVLLLHGFPTSSHMFRELIPVLAERYHVIAPDYPGFGASDMPAAADYAYGFENAAGVVTRLLDAKGVDSYSVYLMDYGAPVGYRMFANDPERVDAFIIQNGNAYEEGLREFWDPIKAYWAEPSAETGDALRGFLTLEATIWQFTHGVKDASAISPDNFWHVQYLLDRPGNQEVQLEMFLDYGSNLDEYARWQALFREHQPPALLMWGANDVIFPEEGAHPYKADLKDLDPALPPGLAHAGNDHLILLLRDRTRLARAGYDLADGAAFMARNGLTTISLLQADSHRRFHSRNAFAIGSVLEDPATGAAAAALGGYLRDWGWPHGGVIEIVQGEDMGAPSLLRAEIGETPGEGIRVSGRTHELG